MRSRPYYVQHFNYRRKGYYVFIQRGNIASVYTAALTMCCI